MDLSCDGERGYQGILSCPYLKRMIFMLLQAQKSPGTSQDQSIDPYLYVETLRVVHMVIISVQLTRCAHADAEIIHRVSCLHRLYRRHVSHF